MERPFAVLVCAAAGACGRIGFAAEDAAPPPAPCLVATDPSRVSAYTFADPTALGRDVTGANDLTAVLGAPQQSTDVPPGFPGYAIAFDGASGLCRFDPATFDPTRDHTACWWTKLTTLADMADQFVNTCSYDTWTSNGGGTYEWRINNCSGGVAANLEVPNAFAAGRWVHLCQTYARASLTRTVYVDGDGATPYVAVDTDPIVVQTPATPWCLGEYAFEATSVGAPMTGLLYAPIWFARVLAPAEIARVHDETCTP